jgi:hypothetical protein
MYKKYIIKIKDYGGRGDIKKIIAVNFPGLKIGGKVKVTTRDGRTWLNPQPEPPLPAKAKPLTK